jgi:hypothetical protein
LRARYFRYDGDCQKVGREAEPVGAETAKKVKQLVAEIIEFADHDALDLVRSRKVAQEVLDILDQRPTMEKANGENRDSHRHADQ